MPTATTTTILATDDTDYTDANGHGDGCCRSPLSTDHWLLTTDHWSLPGGTANNL